MMIEKGEGKMNEIKNETMETRIQKLMEEIEVYKQAIQNAKDALASAEMELDETLDAAYKEMPCESIIQ